ncbi:RidA family protein [Leptolyngbya cf. ectocarpi LEGE 11479]|uniref:RidA family protein n=1 Tax=Leptolyngbya cf. ectocarpi LEGE 11479 TaxID=1828722 RepID=A0A928ZVE3_LEPEC|nr:RidA family protein [Leptolyngbya ectocarpi]MBE9068179.1 RidA family protein [Leptolyngbya cf. ectocarpi LEGE 11479]
MALTNSSELPDSTAYGFAQTGIVPGGTILVYIAGQGSGTTGPGNTYPDSFSEQMEQAFRNLKKALTAVGAIPDDVVKITILSVDHTDEKLQLISAARRAFWPNKKPASTLIPVPRLASTGMLFEIDAVAVIPNP